MGTDRRQGGEGIEGDGEPAVAPAAVEVSERAQLVEAERAARADADRFRDQLEFLVELGRSVVDARDHVELMDQVLHLAVPRIADAGLAMLPEAEGLRRVAVAHRDPEAEALGRESVVGTIDLYERNSPAVEAFRAGEVRARRSTQVRDTSKLPEFLRRTMDSYGLRAWVTVPIKAGREVLGVIALGFNDPEAIEDDQGIALAVELAGRTASGLIDAGRVEHEKQVTLALQTAVLPPALPHVEGWQLAARYLPAQSDRSVGGDWYDALVLPDGRIGASVGDVSGHGVGAAATMGQLRNALRAYTAEGHGPAAAVELLSRLVELTAEDQYASVVCVAVDPATGAVEWASAGHLPMLHLRGDRVDVLDGPHGILVGAVAVDDVPTGRIRMAPGDALVLYTDGLVERRGEDLDLAIRALGAVLAAAAAADASAAEALCDAAISQLDGEAGEDDVCVLVLRRL